MNNKFFAGARKLYWLIGISLIFLSACAKDWPTFRHNILRTANQPARTALSDPTQVPNLTVRWQFEPANSEAFRASPIVYKGKVYVGNGNGRFYALDAETGALIWQYPVAGDPPLTSQFTCNPSSRGIASSATIATVSRRWFWFFRRRTKVVIFGAPDQSIGAGLGSGRLFALNAETGAEVWKSPELARITGLTSGSTTEFHEQIGYSAPLVFNGRVYIGIANHCDNPIQNGKVIAVNLNTGSRVTSFDFTATSSRGGGVWSSVSGWIDSLYVTTGNTKRFNTAEPSINHGLSLLKLDADDGAIDWKLQPVPYELDGDPDWASGASIMLTSCGTLATSTMKDGWTYAVNSEGGSGIAPSVRWQFPPTGFPFTQGDGTIHGDIRFLIPGAAWGDVFISTTGGENVVTAVAPGYNRLHALNACARSSERVRWLLDVPGTASGVGYQLGPPSVTRGMVYIGNRQGQLVVIADPSIWPGAGWRCSNPDVTTADCVPSGFRFVPEPSVLATIDLDPSNPSDRILTEPVLARGRVYVATSRSPGVLYMLEP